MNEKISLFTKIKQVKLHLVSSILLILSALLLIPVIVTFFVILDKVQGFDSLEWLIFAVICAAILMLFSLTGMILVFIAWIKKTDRKISEYLFLAHLILVLSPWGLGYLVLYLEDYKRIAKAERHYESLNLDEKLEYQLNRWGYSTAKQPFGKEEDIEKLIRQGANIDAKNAAGNTPLCTITMQGYRPKLVKYILEKGATLTLKCANGDTALHLAARYCHQQNMEILATYASDLTLPSGNHETPFDLLMAGLERNPYNCVGTALVLQKHSVNISERDNDGNNILHKSAPRTNLDFVRQLVEKAGLDVNIKNNDGFTARELVIQHYEKNKYSTNHPVIVYLSEQESKVSN